MSNKIKLLANNIEISIDLCSLDLSGDESPEQIMEILIEKGLIEVKEDGDYCFSKLYINEIYFP